MAEKLDHYLADQRVGKSAEQMVVTMVAKRVDMRVVTMADYLVGMLVGSTVVLKVDWMAESSAE